MNALLWWTVSAAGLIALCVIGKAAYDDIRSHHWQYRYGYRCRCSYFGQGGLTVEDFDVLSLCKLGSQQIQQAVIDQLPAGDHLVDRPCELRHRSRWMRRDAPDILVVKSP